jgi:hypothetical protein
MNSLAPLVQEAMKRAKPSVSRSVKLMPFRLGQSSTA